VKYSSEIETKSLYIHWPFCAYKCDFCPFVSFAGMNNFMARYNSALLQEIECFFAENKAKKCELETIFIGGGTPSTWPDDLILDTFGRLNSVISVSENIEFTIEVNPGTVRESQFEIFKSIGVNRFSVGVQSLNDSVLKNLNRFQKAQDVYSLLDRAKNYFENISVDLILGLPGVSFEEWKNSLKIVVDLPIKHISVYFLTIYEKTPIYYKIESGEIDLIKDDEFVDIYNWSVDFLESNGFARYEISNFAKMGYECAHNKVYWDRKPYKGFGLAACSFDGTCRFQNHKDLLKYIESVERCEDTSEFCENLTEDQIRLEKIMLGLRTGKGVSRDQIFEGLSKNQCELLEGRVAELKNKNFIYEKNGCFIISPLFLTIENEIVLELLGR
jgi:oxygen-independent coproporphyrinogen III oxidase